MDLPENLKLKLAFEGKAKLYVPDLDYYGVNEPSHAPVFYNPNMVFDRDLSVLVINRFKDYVNGDLRICDALSGIGVRGIRYGLEVKNVDFVWFNDWNPVAVQLIWKNLSLNDFKISNTVSCLDARKMFYMNTNFNSRFHVIDIDPFGSPAKYIHSAIAALRDGGVICVTATDVATLFGVYPLTCLRRYGAVPIKSDFSHENAVRILLGYIVRTVSTFDFSCTPLICYARSHYIRLFLRLNMGIKKVNESIKLLGYIAFCENCLYRIIIKGLSSYIPHTCPNCNSKMSFSGPLWVGNLFDLDFVKGLKDYAVNPILNRFLEVLCDEAQGPPTFYVLDEISRRIKISSPPVNEVIERLKSMGFFASRTHFHIKGIRTNAPIKVIFDVVKSSS
ncbi:MAG: tRNA (guanine(10)-N(2))-dimethyltransferase [Candidatus Methanomethylicia archaeon]